MSTEQKQAEIEISSMTILEYNDEAKTILKNLGNWCSMADFRQTLTMMYVHTVESEHYAEMTHADQVLMAMTFHKLTDFFEVVEVWDSAEVNVKD